MNTQINSSSEELRSAYLEVRARTESICSHLETEDYVPQPTADVSPAKWNIAHTTWFFEQFVLQKMVEDYKLYDETFSYLFNSYYNSFGKRTLRHKRGDLSRPTVKEVFEYRRYVDDHLTKVFDEDISQGDKDIILVGLNHEQQHQELLLTDLKHVFGLNPTFPVYNEKFTEIEKPQLEPQKMIAIESGLKQIGHQGDNFHYDNERGRHTVYLSDFALSSNLVSNREFESFINDGGYKNHRLWHADAWAWLHEQKIESPIYWHQDESNNWSSYTLAGLRPLVPDAPVCHISFYEASAYAEWKGMRLPTEFEWETAADKISWGERWEWTSSDYAPYPKFKAADGALGEYNGKFMVNQKVLRGCSIATSQNHSRKTYRNFFYPQQRWQFTGLRLASD